MNKIKWQRSSYPNDITKARNYSRVMGIDWQYGTFKKETTFAQEIFSKVDDWEQKNEMNIMDAFE